MSGTSTIACSFPRPIAAPLIPSKPRLRFIDGAPDGGAGGEPKPDDDKGKGGSGFAAPASQEELDRIIGERLAREREKFKDHDQLLKDSQELTKLREEKKTADEKAIDAAREEGRTEVRSTLAQERVRFALERELQGRVPNASALLDLDRSRFVKDGQADTEAIKAWVAANSTEGGKGTQSKDLGQGRRDATAGAGSVQTGRELFDSRKKTTS